MCGQLKRDDVAVTDAGRRGVRCWWRQPLVSVGRNDRWPMSILYTHVRARSRLRHNNVEH